MSASTVMLDVRSVEPKERFECIMGAYESLAPADTLDLTVDHDPKCMYYTLRAERGEGTFSFDYVENGPETWRVLVQKLVAGADDPTPAAAHPTNSPS